jgi:hypothetical protein
VLEYLVPSSNKLYHHKMKLTSKLSSDSDEGEVLSSLKQRHPMYFMSAAERIKDLDNQVLDLIRKLIGKASTQENQPSRAKKQPKSRLYTLEDQAVTEKVSERPIDLPREPPRESEAQKEPV